jgi:hypothetical protein
MGLLFMFPVTAPALAFADSLTHDMRVVLQPTSSRLIVDDVIGFMQPRKVFRFRLNAGLEVEAKPGTLERLDDDPQGGIALCGQAGLFRTSQPRRHA